MVLFKRTREIFWKKSVLKFLKNNNRRAHALSLAEAKHIGVFFVYSDRSHYKKVEEFVSVLKKNAKKVELFVFVDAKDLAEDFPDDLRDKVYTKRDLNWKYQAKRNVLKSFDAFLSENFDILLQLSREENRQAVYVSAVSKAKFKIGIKGDWAYQINDVTYDLPEESEFSEYLSMIMRYTTNFS